MSIAGQAGEVSRQAISFVEPEAPAAEVAEGGVLHEVSAIGATALTQPVGEAVVPTEAQVQQDADPGYIVVNGTRLRKPRPVNSNPEPVFLAPDSRLYRP